MHWLHGIGEAAPALPAVWLIASGARPANLRERSSLRRSTAREVLARQFELPLDATELGHDEAGRPFIARPAGSGLHLSLATRAGLVAIAVGTRPIGVDVELVDPASEPPLAVLHPAETLVLERLPRSELAAAFAKLWAAKEAYVKALGTGFVRPPDSFAVTLDDAGGFLVEDGRHGLVVHGAARIMENGGHVAMAAAVVTL